jgi:ABC-type transport system substrate-binding protein
MTEGFDRRSFLARSALTAAGITLGAGAVEGLGQGSAWAVQTNGPGLNGISTQRPKRGGKLTVGVSAEEQGFNPTTGRFDGAGYLYARTVYDQLLATTAVGGFAPYLAQSITSNSSFTTWTITLRPNVKFHDGTPCDGAALLRNVDGQYKSALTGVAVDPVIASYVQSGPLSIAITLKYPWVDFPVYLATSQINFVAAPSMLDAPNGGTSNPVGTGPFKFKEWVPNDHFTAVANESYWRPGLPYLSEVTFKPIPDEQARAEALQSGTIQIMNMIGPSEIKEFRGSKQWAYVDNSGRMVGSPNVNCAMLNLSKPPFDDLLARQVLATGTSSQQYSKIIDQGVNGPVNGIYLPTSPYYTGTPYPKYNPAKAKSLADQYAQKHGAPLSYTHNVVAAPDSIRQGEYSQQIMKNIGVQVTLNPMQQNELIDSALFGTFQSTAWSQFGAISPSANFIWMSQSTYSPTGISINMARNSDPQIQQAFLEGMAATEQSVRVAAYGKVNQRLGADLPYIFVDRSTWAIASKPTVQNWNNPVAPGGQPLLGNDQGVWWITQTWIS